MTVIDLGELRGDLGPGPPSRPPPAVGRPLRVMTALVLALATLASGAPVPRRATVTVPTPLDTRAFLTDGRLFVSETGEADVGGTGWLAAYALPVAGVDAVLAPLWRTPVPGGGANLPGAGANVSVVARGDMVLLTGPSAGDGSPRTVMFDATTGGVRWQQPGYPAEASNGDLLLADPGEPGSSTIRAVEPTTGRSRWSVPMPPEGVSFRYRDYDKVDRIVSTPPSGQVEVWDATSGVKLRGVHVRPGELPSFQQAQVVGDLLLVTRENATTVTAYGLDGLDRRWEARLALVAYFTSCGDLLCGYGQTGGMWALDPATGRVRWRDLVHNMALAERGGRLLVAASGRQSGETFSVLDSGTGQVVADLGSWELARWTDPDDPVIGLRRGRDGRMLVAELDVAAARVKQLDLLPDVSGYCQVDGRTLLCRRIDATFGLWRLPD